MSRVRRAGSVAGVVAVLSIVYLVAWGTQSGSPRPAAEAVAATAPVTSVDRSCPPPGPGTGTASVATVAADSSGTSAGKSGTTALTAIPDSAQGADTTVKTSSEPNAPQLLPAPQSAAAGATQVSVSGSAAGFEAELATSAGVGTVTCGHPESVAWFVGLGTSTGASSITAYLSNTGAMPADTELTIWTDAGPQPGSNVTVPAHQYLSVNLASLVQGSQVMAVQVQTSSGQVGANVWEAGGSGGAWLPQAAAPATRVVIPGLTAQANSGKLLLAVPGGTDAEVTVTAVTAQGAQRPLGATAQDVPSAAGSVISLGSLASSASALVLTSNVPITAAVQIPGSGVGGFTAATAPVSEQGVVAGNPSGGDTVGVVLSAPGAGARVTVATIPGSGSAGAVSRTVTVAPGRSVETTVAAPRGGSGPFAIVVTPQRGSGPVYAARIVTKGGSGVSGQILSVLPVANAPTSVQLPPADNSYTAVLPLSPGGRPQCLPGGTTPSGSDRSAYPGDTPGPPYPPVRAAWRASPARGRRAVPYSSQPSSR
jgi:hypothetical protein